MIGKICSKASLSTAGDRADWIASADDIYINQVNNNIMRDSGFDDPNQWTLIGGASIASSTLLCNGTASVAKQDGHTLTEGDTYTVSINRKSGTDGGFTLWCGSSFKTFEETAGVVTADIIVPAGADYFQISTYQIGGIWPTGTFDDFKAEKISSGEIPVEGLIVNTTDQIWDDMTLLNDIYPCNAKYPNFPQFTGPQFDQISKNLSTGFTHANMWIEIEAWGDGTACSDSLNRPEQPIQARIETGYIRFFLLRGGVWTQIGYVKNPNTDVNGNAWFIAGSSYGGGGYRDCSGTIGYSPAPAAIGTSGDGFMSFMPISAYRLHAYRSIIDVTPTNTIEAIYGQCYMRKVANGGTDVNDIHLGAHMSTDIKHYSGGSLINDGAYGISRLKEITTDWKSFNFMTYITKAALEANPPPFSSTP